MRLFLLPVLTGLLLLAGCGQKGDLYIPQETAPAQLHLDANSTKIHTPSVSLQP